MKTRFFIFSTLCLAVLCLDSASIAMAQSVTGGGVVRFDPDEPPTSINVAARTGPAGIVHVGTGGSQGFQSVGNVVDLCVVDNAAIVVSEITHVSGENAPPVGFFLYWVFQDNGRTGDRALLFDVKGEFSTPCLDLVESLPTILEWGLATITAGNITITP